MEAILDDRPLSQAQIVERIGAEPADTPRRCSRASGICGPSPIGGTSLDRS